MELSYHYSSVDAVQSEESTTPVDDPSRPCSGKLCIGLLPLEGTEVARHLVLEGFKASELLGDFRKFWDASVS